MVATTRSNDLEVAMSPLTIIQKTAINLMVVTAISNAQEHTMSLPTITLKVVPYLMTVVIKSNALEAVTSLAASTWSGAYTDLNKAHEKGTRGETDMMVIKRPRHLLQSKITT